MHCIIKWRTIFYMLVPTSTYLHKKMVIGAVLHESREEMSKQWIAFFKQFHHSKCYSKKVPTWTDVHCNISRKEMSKHWKDKAVPLFELPITAPLFSRARSIFCFLDRRGGEEESYISLSGIPFNVLLCLSKVDEEKVNCTKRSQISMFWWNCCCSINLN